LGLTVIVNETYNIRLRGLRHIAIMSPNTCFRVLLLMNATTSLNIGNGSF